MAYWLVKADPSDYSWEMLERDGETEWTGIRNFQARNFLKEMEPGDSVFVYQTQEDKSIVGVAEVVRTAAPDPTDDTGKWISVKLKALKPVGRPLSIEEIRNTHGLAVMPLVDQPRLTVMPVNESQKDAILKYSKTT
jgi:predicted RNA-binding protein with PUA-like domain